MVKSIPKTPQEAAGATEAPEPTETPAHDKKAVQNSNMSESETRADRITLYFTGEVMEKIALIARAQDKSKNKLLTEIIEKKLKKKKYDRIYEAMKSIQEDFQNESRRRTCN